MNIDDKASDTSSLLITFFKFSIIEEQMSIFFFEKNYGTLRVAWNFIVKTQQYSTRIYKFYMVLKH